MKLNFVLMFYNHDSVFVIVLMFPQYLEACKNTVKFNEENINSFTRLSTINAFIPDFVDPTESVELRIYDVPQTVSNVFEMKEAPTSSTLMKWKDELQEATRNSSTQEVFPYMEIGSQRYSVDSINSLLMVHKARQIQNDVVEELGWFFSQPVVMLQLEKKTGGPQIGPFQDLVFHKRWDEVLEEFNMDGAELAQICCDRLLSGDHIQWFISQLNKMQKNVFCIYPHSGHDPEVVANHFSQGQSPKPSSLAFILNVFRSGNDVFLGTQSQPGSHFTFCYLDTLSSTVTYGDSLGWPVPIDLQETVSQYFMSVYSIQSPDFEVVMCHDSTSFSGDSFHTCSDKCSTYYPLQTCGTICSVICMFICAIACLNHNFFVFLTSVQQDKTYPGIPYLQNPTKYSKFLREILVVMFGERTIDIEYLTPKYFDKYQLVASYDKDTVEKLDLTIFYPVAVPVPGLLRALLPTKPENQTPTNDVSDLQQLPSSSNMTTSKEEIRPSSVENSSEERSKQLGNASPKTTEKEENKIASSKTDLRVSSVEIPLSHKAEQQENYSSSGMTLSNTGDSKMGTRLPLTEEASSEKQSEQFYKDSKCKTSKQISFHNTTSETDSQLSAVEKLASEKEPEHVQLVSLHGMETAEKDGLTSTNGPEISHSLQTLEQVLPISETKEETSHHSKAEFENHLTTTIWKSPADPVTFNEETIQSFTRLDATRNRLPILESIPSSGKLVIYKQEMPCLNVLKTALIPKAPVLLSWQDQLQKAGTDNEAKAYIETDTNTRYDLNGVRQALVLSKAHQIARDVNEELNWFSGYKMIPLATLDLPKKDSVTKFRKMLYSYPWYEIQPGYNMSSHELAQICCKRTLSDKHIQWTLNTINLHQADTVCIFFSPSEDILPDKASPLKNTVKIAPPSSILFIFCVFRLDGHEDVIVADEATECQSEYHYTIGFLDVASKKLIYGDTYGWPAPRRLQEKVAACYQHQNGSLLPTVEVVLCHDQTFRSSDGMHVCSPLCATYFPLHTPDSTTGVFIAVLSAIACLAPDYFNFLVSVQYNKLYTGTLALHMYQPALHSNYLRRVLVTWFSTKTINISNVVPRADFDKIKTLKVDGGAPVVPQGQKWEDTLEQ